MSTPKPGQIRCPTCLRSTPPASYCTQCGSPIPPSARARPRGMDRDELEERVRRRPGDGGFRRGQQVDDSPASAGYVPFEPEPEDALAVRPEHGDQAIYTGPAPAADETDQFEPLPRRAEPRPAPEPEAAVPPRPPVEQRSYPQPPAYIPPPAPPPPAAESSPQEYATDEYAAEEDAADEYADPEAYGVDDDRPYGEPEDAYAYPYAAPQERSSGGGGGALPIIGFVVLCIMALAVGAVLAGLLGGEDQVGQATPTPTASTAPATSEPTTEPTPVPTESSAPATPEPTDGPVTFADGAVYEVEPCGSYEFTSDLAGCEVDGSTRDNGNVWVLVIFSKASGDDTITLSLRQNGQTIAQEEKVLGSVVDCGDSCRGLIWGAVYRDLDPGDYELVLRRNGDFADRAAFIVGG